MTSYFHGRVSFIPTKFIVKNCLFRVKYLFGDRRNIQTDHSPTIQYVLSAHDIVMCTLPPIEDNKEISSNILTRADQEAHNSTLQGGIPSTIPTFVQPI